MQEYIIFYSGDCYFSTEAENIKEATLHFMQFISDDPDLRDLFRMAVAGCSTTEAVTAMLTFFADEKVEKIVRVCDPDDNRPENHKAEKPTLRIVVMIENGVLTGVYSDGDPVMVDLIDYDDLKAKDYGEECMAEVEEIEAEIKNGKFVSCW